MMEPNELDMIDEYNRELKKIVVKTAETKGIRPFTTYTLQITVTLILNEIPTEQRQFAIQRRYSQFREFHKELLAKSLNPPNLPGKMYFRSLRASVIEARMKSLQTYCDELLKRIHESEINTCLRNFLAERTKVIRTTEEE